MIYLIEIQTHTKLIYKIFLTFKFASYFAHVIIVNKMTTCFSKHKINTVDFHIKVKSLIFHIILFLVKKQYNSGCLEKIPT